MLAAKLAPPGREMALGLAEPEVDADNRAAFVAGGAVVGGGGSALAGGVLPLFGPARQLSPTAVSSPVFTEAACVGFGGGISG